MSLQGEMDGPCANLRHRGSNREYKSRATFWNRRDHQWVCYDCAIAHNRDIIARHSRALADARKCVPGKEHMWELLTNG
jgi:hypothetical protein